MKGRRARRRELRSAILLGVALLMFFLAVIFTIADAAASL